MKQLDLKKIIDKKLLKVNVSATNKEKVLQQLCELLIEENYIESVEEFLESVYLREEEGLTGIGNGIAIPHGKSSAVLKTTFVVAVLSNPIQWETLDDEDVEVIILFAVKDTDSTTKHILLLQKVSILLANDDFIEELKNVDTDDQLYDLFMENIK